MMPELTMSMIMDIDSTNCLETTGRIETTLKRPPTYLPKNHFLIEALLKSYREVTGDDSEPVSGTSASYSKVMANIAAFGAHYPGEGISWEQTDESLEIDTLIKTTKIYANAIYRLCTEI